MRITMPALAAGLIGLMTACGSGLPPSHLATSTAPVNTTSPEPTADVFADPRATVTAFFESYDPPYKRVYRHHLSAALWDPEFAPGIYMSGWDEVNQRFTYGVLTEKTKAAIAARAVAIGLPESMLDIEVRPQLTPRNPPVKTADGQFEISLEFSDPIEISGATEFTVAVVNHGPDTRELVYNSAHPADIVVFSADGDQLWRLFPPLLILPAATAAIAPGEAIQFPVEWDGKNDDRQFLPSGEYLVRAFAGSDLSTPAVRFSLIATP